MPRSAPLFVGSESNSIVFTAREMEVVECIQMAYTNREIATEFGISVETVKRHVSNIFDKLGCSNRTELVVMTLDGRWRNRQLLLTKRRLLAMIAEIDAKLGGSNDDEAEG